MQAKCSQPVYSYVHSVVCYQKKQMKRLLIPTGILHGADITITSLHYHSTEQHVCHQLMQQLTSGDGRENQESCLDSPPHPLVNPSLSSSPLSFILSLQAQNLPFQQILPTLDFLYLLDCIMILDWTGPIMLIILFLVSHFNFFVYSMWWTKLATCQLFTAHQIHTIVSYCISVFQEMLG